MTDYERAIKRFNELGTIVDYDDTSITVVGAKFVFNIYGELVERIYF